MNASNNTIGEKETSRNTIDPILFHVVMTANLLCFSQAISLFGLFTNVLNIINFKRQGYRDGVNVTLTALAVSDFGALVVQQVYIYIVNPWFSEDDLIMSRLHMTLLVVYANEYFIRVGGFITTFAAFERCLCVVLPMKVKTVVTPKVAVVVHTSIFVTLTWYLLVPYCLVYIDWKFLPDSNRTVLFVYFKENRESIIDVYYLVSGLCIPYVTIFLLLIFTVILTTKLTSSSRWRRNATSSEHRAQSVSSRERKAVKMLTTVAALYVACLVPHSAINTAMGLISETMMHELYMDVISICYSFTTLLMSINSSVTVLIYYRMSSKYRQVLLDMFSCSQEVKGSRANWKR